MHTTDFSNDKISAVNYYYNDLNNYNNMSCCTNSSTPNININNTYITNTNINISPNYQESFWEDYGYPLYYDPNPQQEQPKFHSKKSQKSRETNKFSAVAQAQSGENVQSTQNHTKKQKKNKKKAFHSVIESNLYQINLENLIRGVDLRTTIMVRNIPNKYSTQHLLAEIDKVSKNCYDFFYLPQDNENNCNLGYAFINFVDPLHIVNFYIVFKDRKWDRYNSFKKCDLTFAKFQGKGELTAQLEKNTKEIEDKSKLPKVFELEEVGEVVIPRVFLELMKKYRPLEVEKVKWE